MKNKIMSMIVSVCAIGKWEEQYLVEWVDHYKSLGFDNIIFYDNNEEGNDGQYVVLKDYIDEGFVIYNDWRGKTGNKVQRSAYSNCMGNYREKYDWIAFFDVDEFLELVEHKTIKDFLNGNKNFNDFAAVYLNWVNYKNDELIENQQIPVKKRFLDPIETSVNKLGAKIIINKSNIKCIVNTNCCGKGVISVHYPFVDKHHPMCDSNGVAARSIGHKIRYGKIDKYPAYIKHYRYKSLEEFLCKIERGYCCNWITPLCDKEKFTDSMLKMYFMDHTFTLRKNKYIYNFFDSIRLKHQEECSI